MICMFISRVGIFFIHLLHGKRYFICYFFFMAEVGFNALLCFGLVVLGVDEGFALITVNGVFAEFFSRGKAMDGLIAANYG